MQIGDRKMDSGALEPGETLDDDFDMENDFLPEELIWLMDQMLNREVCCSCRCCSFRSRPAGRLADGLSAVANVVHLSPY